MSKALVTKMKAEAVGHELKATEMLRCAKRLLDLAERRTKVAAGLRQATAVLSGEKKRGRGRPRKAWIGASTRPTPRFTAAQKRPRKVKSLMKNHSYTYNASAGEWQLEA
jgi:hypothetical protein